MTDGNEADMTDAEKLRELADLYEHGYPVIEIIEWQADLRRIASLLDAVPPETLIALKDNKVRVMPPDPPLISITITDAHKMSPQDWYKLWWLAAARAKPEE